MILCKIDFNFQIVAMFIFGLLGLGVFLYQLLKLFSKGKGKDKTKKSNMIGILLVSGCCVLFGINGVYQWLDFRNNQQKTIGTTIQVNTYPKGATQIEYEYVVHGKRYLGESTYYPADLNNIKIPGGKYPVFYNKNKPKVSEMDFSKVPQNRWQ